MTMTHDSWRMSHDAMKHFALLLLFTACVGRVEKTGEFDKSLLFDAAAECVPSVVSLELDSNAAAMLQVAEKAGAISMKVTPPSEEAVRAAANRPFVVVNPDVPPRHPPNEALLAGRRQATTDLPAEAIPAKIVPVWDVAYPSDALADLDAVLSALPTSSSDAQPRTPHFALNMMPPSTSSPNGHGWRGPAWRRPVSKKNFPPSRFYNRG